MLKINFERSRWRVSCPFMCSSCTRRVFHFPVCRSSPQSLHVVAVVYNLVADIAFSVWKFTMPDLYTGCAWFITYSVRFLWLPGKMHQLGTFGVVATPTMASSRFLSRSLPCGLVPFCWFLIEWILMTFHTRHVHDQQRNASQAFSSQTPSRLRWKLKLDW